MINKNTASFEAVFSFMTKGTAAVVDGSIEINSIVHDLLKSAGFMDL